MGFSQRKNTPLHPFNIPNTNAPHLPPPKPFACIRVRYSTSLLKVTYFTFSLRAFCLFAWFWVLGFLTLHGSAQRLLLGTIWDAKDRTWVHYVQRKFPISLATTPIPKCTSLYLVHTISFLLNQKIFTIYFCLKKNNPGQHLHHIMNVIWYVEQSGLVLIFYFSQFRNKLWFYYLFLAACTLAVKIIAQIV